MIPLTQIRDLVVVPALTAIGHAEPAAIRLVIGTGLIESQYEYLAQVGGPALGPFQMEPATAQDIHDNYLAYQASLNSSLVRLMVAGDLIMQLAWNWLYAAAMCRIKYLRSPLPLPNVDDLEGMAQYWLQVYNAGGKGNASVFVERANQFGLMSL